MCDWSRAGLIGSVAALVFAAAPVVAKKMSPVSGDPVTTDAGRDPRDVRRVDFGDTIRTERLNGDALAFLLANRPTMADRPPPPAPAQKSPAVPPSPTY